MLSYVMSPLAPLLSSVLHSDVDPLYPTTRCVGSSAAPTPVPGQAVAERAVPIHRHRTACMAMQGAAAVAALAHPRSPVVTQNLIRMGFTARATAVRRQGRSQWAQTHRLSLLGGGHSPLWGAGPGWFVFSHPSHSVSVLCWGVSRFFGRRALVPSTRANRALPSPGRAWAGNAPIRGPVARAGHGGQRGGI